MYTIQSERLTAAEYVDFLRRTDLGSQYPKERFQERIQKLVRNVPINLTARAPEGTLLGVCFGITDFAYWLFITDLGVDRNHTGQGIGKALMREAHRQAGGERDIILYTCANKNAVPFYQKLGLTPSPGVMEYDHADWTSFVVE